jgi:hypothetical protein
MYRVLSHILRSRAAWSPAARRHAAYFSFFYLLKLAKTEASKTPRHGHFFHFWVRPYHKACRVTVKSERHWRHSAKRHNHSKANEIRTEQNRTVSLHNLPKKVKMRLSEAQCKVAALLTKTKDLVACAADTTCDKLFDKLAEFATAMLKENERRKEQNYDDMKLEELLSLSTPTGGSFSWWFLFFFLSPS